MTPQDKEENLKKIREACISANPEIMELKFGCEIKTRFGRYNYVKSQTTTERRNIVRVIVAVDEHGLYETFSSKDIKILGRPIHLADVLLAIYRNTGIDKPTIGFDGRGFYFNDSDRYVWNLKDDNLEHQSEETINFIASLL